MSKRLQPTWQAPAKKERAKLQLFNSLTRKKEEFVPLDRNNVTWYSCGPTVYDASHMGHARSYISFDILRRVLSEYFGYNIHYVMNITDIDDKIIKRARQNHLYENYIQEVVSAPLERLLDEQQQVVAEFENTCVACTDTDKRQMLDKMLHRMQVAVEELKQAVAQGDSARIAKARQAYLTEAKDPIAEWMDKKFGASVTNNAIFESLPRFWEEHFHNDMKALNVLPPDVLTRVSEYVPEIIAFIQRIIVNGLAYEANGSIYFDVLGFDKREKHHYAKLVPEAFGDTKSLQEGEGDLSVAEDRFAQKVLFSINNYLNRSKKTRSELNEGFALLTRLYARRANSFRHLIGFRSVSKLNVALKRVRIIDLERELESFRSALPDISLADHPQGEVPTRQSLEYILVRCITMHYIYKRIEECCLGVADFCVNNIHLNRFLDYSTLLLANAARIKTLNGCLGKKCRQMYSELLEQRFNFPNGKHEFVKADTELPEPAELEEFAETCQPEDKVEQQQITINASSVNAPKILKVDLGKAVQRAKECNKFDIKKLDSVEKVRKFIESETNARKKSAKDCITHKLQNHEWIAAKKLFERKIIANDVKKALTTFCKFISSKI